MTETDAQTTSGGSRVDDRIFDGLERIHADAAGIDVGSEEHYVSVPEDRDEQPVRKFGCYTPDLEQMAQWLKKCRIRTVVMESTGVYWVPLFRILEEHGFDVNLVDARHAKNVPGRKTDVWDSCWLRKLHTFGLLRGCFIPPKEIQVVRGYWRHRSGIVQSCAQQIHLMQKALEQMNVQLHKAISDITGVTGMIIIRAIVGGEHDPVKLSKLEHPRIKSSDEEIVKALTGHYTDEQLFVLQQALEAYDFYQHQLEECDKAIQQCMARFEDRGSKGGSAPPLQPRRVTPRKNQPHFDLGAELARIMGVDLTKIPGIDAMTAQVIFTEVGRDLSAFPTDAHFASWLALCPNNRITGGRVRSSRTRRTQNRVATAFRVAAQSLHHSKTALGAFYRRKKAQLGAPKAITATAHKLARIVYRMIKHGEAYVAQGNEEYEARLREQDMRRLQRTARRMGCSLVLQATGEVLT